MNCIYNCLVRSNIGLFQYLTYTPMDDNKWCPGVSFKCLSRGGGGGGGMFAIIVIHRGGTNK